MLMDRATLLAHQSQWVIEPCPATAVLNLLTPAEQGLYGALRANMFGSAVRLEQERVSFTALEAALTPSNCLCHRSGTNVRSEYD
jgi:hypothetical protein